MWFGVSGEPCSHCGQRWVHMFGCPQQKWQDRTWIDSVVGTTPIPDFVPEEWASE